MKNIKYMLMTLAALTLFACSDNFSGRYEASGGMQEFNFKSDGHMIQSLGGNEIAEFKFKKDGDNIKVSVNDSMSQTFKIQANGDLIGPAGIKLTPKK